MYVAYVINYIRRAQLSTCWVLARFIVKISAVSISKQFFSGRPLKNCRTHGPDCSKYQLRSVIKNNFRASHSTGYTFACISNNSICNELKAWSKLYGPCECQMRDLLTPFHLLQEYFHHRWNKKVGNEAASSFVQSSKLKVSFTRFRVTYLFTKALRLKGLLRLAGFRGFLLQTGSKNFASMHNTQSEQNTNKICTIVWPMYDVFIFSLQ